MEMEILLLNKVEQEIAVYSTTEFNGCIVLCNDVLIEGTPKNYENCKVQNKRESNLFTPLLMHFFFFSITAYVAGSTHIVLLDN